MTISTRTLLEQATREELIRFLQELSEENHAIEKRIHLEFGESDPKDEYKESVDLIRDFIRRNSDRGFVSYRQLPKALEGAWQVLKRGERHLDKKAHHRGFMLGMAVFREGTKLASHCDSSSGELTDLITQAESQMRSAAELLEGAERAETFGAVVKEAQLKHYEGWSDQQVALVEIAELLVGNAKERQTLLKACHKIAGSESLREYYSSYLEEHFALVEYRLIKRFDGETPAQGFLTFRVRYPKIREILIQQALDANNHEEAERLCLEGETADAQHAGLVEQWQKYRAKVFLATGRTQEWRSLMRKFIISGDHTAFKALKQSMGTEEWIAERGPLLNSLAKSRGRFLLYGTALVEEEQWPLLLQYVREEKRNYWHYASLLHQHYPEETASLGMELIQEEAEKSNARPQYKGICKQLKSLAELDETKARWLVGTFRSLYRNRPAMMEELVKAFGAE